ncbi:hypothetical protein MBLNU459_g0208t1 [Dothideomycetes sp. NU459]
MLSEGAELVGESGRKYLAVSPLGQANVWTAVEVDDTSNIVVIKEPSADDTSPGWPDFQNEMVMHELLKDSSSIRKQVDRIPPTKEGEPPMLVLEIFETTLWSARAKRPFTTAEVKSVTKDALVGLADVHARGLVYADLKMQNIMVDGFDADAPTDDPSHLTATLGDLGIVMAPSHGKVQPVSYRAPEVYFKGEITPKADIWGWGLIYCHMLEARNRFSKTGLYDDLDSGNGTMFEREQAVRYAISNDYKIQNNAYFQDVPLPPKDDRTHKGDQWEELRRRGLEDGEVDFLRWVMRADPRKRPSAAQILQCGWLDKDDEAVAAGFEVPANGIGEASLEFDPARSSPATAAHQEEEYGEPQEARVGTESSSTIFDGSTSVKPSTTINDAIEEAYATRAAYKRQLSQPTDRDPASRPAFMPGVRSDTVAEFSNSNAGPAPFDTGPVTGAESSGPPTTQKPATRPGLSTTNTGTFLSYR